MVAVAEGVPEDVEVVVEVPDSLLVVVGEVVAVEVGLTDDDAEDVEVPVVLGELVDEEVDDNV